MNRSRRINRIADTVFIVGCILLAVSVPMPMEGRYWFLCPLLGLVLIAISQVMAPFLMRPRSINEAPIVDHTATADVSRKDDRAI